MNRNLGDVAWQSLLLGSLTVSGILVFNFEHALAQVIPDNTLGGESSVVNPRDATSDKIDGGAIRGQNLFHSFQEFNVDAGRGVYFTNPEAITNIFSRVTGKNISNILGTLGVDGAANLFLINPNGIIFGENASLDVQGSFAATTANGVRFGEQGFFSATKPEQSSLLKIDPGAFFYNQVVNQPGNIINRANLASGQDLTLDANNLDLQGQTLAGQNLTLSALDTVRIRDSVDNPFIGGAGGNLLIQGNETVDIFALNNPESGFFSGGEMVLQSANPISSDAIFLSGGNFRIEQLNGNYGNLSSKEDPIIFANGDISFNNYEGASLHILAGGSVNANNIVVTGTAPQDNSINPTTRPELANISLSNNTQLTIDGSTQPTVDIRAGIDWNQLGGFPGNFGVGVDVPAEIFGENATSADINIGVININQPDGLVFLTNQYLPNSSLPRGNIQVETILTGDLFFDFFGDGSSILVDSRNNFTVGNQIDTSSEFGNAGKITLIADNEITLDNSLISSGTAGNFQGGNIDVQAKSLFLVNNTQIIANTLGQGTGGHINIDSDILQIRDSIISASTTDSGTGGNLNINVAEYIQLIGDFINSNNSIAPSGLFIQVQGTGNAGNLELEAKDLIVTNGAQISAATTGLGNGGDINIQANYIELTGESKASGFRSGILAPTNNDGDGGNITITTKSLAINNNGQIFTQARQGKGNAGDIKIDSKILTLEDNSSISADLIQGFGKAGTITIVADNVSLKSNSRISTSAQDFGQAGNLNVDAESFSVKDSSITANTFGSGKGGNLNINVSGSIELSGDSLNSDGTIAPSGLFTQAQELGHAGNLIINTNNLILSNGAQISASTSGTGKGGDISIQSSILEITGKSEARDSFSGIFVSTDGDGDGGNINITTENLTLSEGGLLSAESQQGEGNGGNITIDSKILNLESNSKISGVTITQGQGGDVAIKTNALVINEGAQISASTIGAGEGGDIFIEANDIKLIGSLNNSQFPSGIFASTNGDEDGGNIAITSKSFVISEGGRILTEAQQGNGNAGDIKIESNIVTLEGNSAISAFSSSEGKGGNVKINIQKLIIKDSAISSGTLGTGQGGNIQITATDSLQISGKFTNLDDSVVPSAITVGALGGNAAAGNLTINTGDLLIRGGQINASTKGKGNGGNIAIKTKSLELIGVPTLNSGIFGNTEDLGKGGMIEINAKSLIVKDNASIFAQAFDEGDGGNINLMIDNLTLETGAAISTSTLSSGNAGNLIIDTQQLIIEDSAISSNTTGLGQGGNIEIIASDLVQIIGNFINSNGTVVPSAISVETLGGDAVAGNLTIETGSLIINGGQISANTEGSGTGGTIVITTDSLIAQDNARIVSTASDIGEAGNINIVANNLTLESGTAVATLSRREGKAGNIFVTVNETLNTKNSLIRASSAQSAGGEINIKAQDIRLSQNSDIDTFVVDGAGGGGNIAITANSIIAFDDSDIFAFAQDGQGGNVTLNTPAYFGENFTRNSLTSNPNDLDNNSRADINATGAVSGDVSIPDVSFIQNSLTELQNNAIDTDELVANSCVVRSRQNNGKFIITGTDSLPLRPGNAEMSEYPTGEVRSIPDNNNSGWQPGDPIIEPQGVYRLTNGKLVLSRECPE